MKNKLIVELVKKLDLGIIKEEPSKQCEDVILFYKKKI